jgi:hypothetical protein
MVPNSPAAVKRARVRPSGRHAGCAAPTQGVGDTAGMNASSPASAAPRCDRMPAWAALQGHYEAHGRDFDLREAFARDPQRVVWTSGALWGIDSFDQWGVELGKSLAQRLVPRFASGDVTGLDPSTAALLRRLREPG